MMIVRNPVLPLSYVVTYVVISLSLLSCDLFLLSGLFSIKLLEKNIGFVII
jgi:hypothetical protein